MKHMHIKKFIGTALLSILLFSCSKILDEQPRSAFTPVYFNTKDGAMSAITSLYANLRYFYGNAYYYNMCETGTDEATYAQSADNNFKVMDLSGQGALNSQSYGDPFWGTAFPMISTASGIMEKGPALNVDTSAIAEAAFFRGFTYFVLVQTYGGRSEE